MSISRIQINSKTIKYIIPTLILQNRGYDVDVSIKFCCYFPFNASNVLPIPVHPLEDNNRAFAQRIPVQ